MAASKLSNDDKEKRLIYTVSCGNRYIAGDHEKYKRWQDLEVKEVLDNALQGSGFLNKLLEASKDRFFPNRSQLFYLLAKYAHTSNPKDDFQEAVRSACKTDEDFFDFIQQCAKQRGNKAVKLPKCVIKAVKKFYESKTPKQIVESYIHFNSRHGWSHKDLIKLCHVKSSTPLMNVVINYILFKKSNDEDKDEEKRELISILKKSEQLRHTKEEVDAVPLIFELKATISQVCPLLYQSQPVWAAALENMTVQETLPYLLKLYKLSFLKANSPTLQIVVNNLTSTEKVKSCGIHPLEVFIQWKTFEKGGKPIDPKLLQHLKDDLKIGEEDLKKFEAKHEVKCPAVINALKKCMHLACSNITPTNKRYMITIDITENMRESKCLGNKTITSIEAAVAYVHVLLRVEKDVTVATYGDTEIHVVNLKKGGTYEEHYEKITSGSSKSASPYLPIEWALSKREHIDVFVNFVHFKCYYTLPKELKEKLPKSAGEIMTKYRKKVNLQNSKLIFFCPPSHILMLGHGEGLNIMDAGGYDLNVCRAVDAFCRGSFS